MRLRAVLPILWLAASGVVAHVLGLAGYRAGFVWAALLVAGGCTAVTAIVARRTPGAWAWIAAAAVAGLTVAAVLVDAAPLSRGRLRQEFDALKLQGFRLLAAKERGHSWCRPSCPRLVRTYEVALAPRPALITVAVAAYQADLVRNPLPPSGEPFVVRTESIRVDVRVVSTDPRTGSRIEISFTSRR